MNLGIPACVEDLIDAGVDCVTYACTSGSFFGGPAFDAQVREIMAPIAQGRPIITTSGALVGGLRALGRQRPLIATPYTDDINARLLTFLAAYGFEVVGVAGRQYSSNVEIAADSPDAIVNFVRENFVETADAVVIACTAWRGMETATELEESLARPVLTANQATLWASLRAMGMRDVVEGFGALLAS